MDSFRRLHRSTPSPCNPDPPSGHIPPSRGCSFRPQSVSRKSLTGLFSSKSASENSPKHEDSREAKASDNGPSTQSPESSPTTSPFRLRKKRSRSLSRSRSGSFSGSKSLLGYMAGGLKAAAGIFHKDAFENQDKATERPTTSKSHGTVKSSPGTIKASPSKQVRFKSEADEYKQTDTSPIDIPKRTAPSLPPLELSAALVMDPEGNPITDAPLTGRPPDTPVLKALVKDTHLSPFSSQWAPENGSPEIRDDYFFPLPSQTLTSNQENMPPAASLQDLKQANQGPLADVASDLRPEDIPLPTLSESTASESRTPSVSSRAIDERPHVLNVRNISGTLSKEDHPSRRNPFSDNAASDIYSQRALPAGATHEDIRHRFKIRSGQGMSDGWNSPTSDSTEDCTPSDVCDVSLRPILNIQEAMALHPHAQTASADDSEVSAVRKELESMSLTDPVKPTTATPLECPDKSPVAAGGSVSPTSLRATISSTSPSRPRRPFRFPNQAKQKTEAESIGNTSFSWEVRDSDQMITPECIPQALSDSAGKILGFNLGSTRTLSCPEDSDWSPFTEPGFAHALRGATTDVMGVKNISHTLSKQGGFAALWKALALPKRTAPPCNIPVVGPDEIGALIAKVWERCKDSVGRIDQHPWSPFDEPLFPGTLVRANHAMGLNNVHAFLSQKGGFATLWQEMNLPPKFAPKEDTQPLNYDDCEKMVQKAWSICGHSAPRDQHGWHAFHETQFPSSLVSAISATGEDHIRSLLSEERGMAKFWRQFTLPKSTAPNNDTRALSREEITKVIELARNVCGYKSTINPEVITIDSMMAPMYSPYMASSRNYFSPLGSADIALSADTASLTTTTSCGSHRGRRQYSSEVSTVASADPSDSSDNLHAHNHIDEGYDQTCSKCESRTSCEISSAGERIHEDDKENVLPPNTPLASAPTRHRAVEHVTPKQSDYAIERAAQVVRLGLSRSSSAPKDFSSSEHSNSGSSRASSAAYSEDEHYAKNII